jgi:SAM-dependent methyltransferase
VIQTEDLPLPPREYVDLVIGPTGPIEGFLSQGRLATEILSDALARHGYDLASLEKVLDWGCGCGRVLRWWAGWDGPRFYGSDYNPELVDWCQENLPHVTAKLNGLSPPLRFEDGTLDLVYALSVFTHLAEDRQQLWMDEIARVLKPGGLFFFTTNGDAPVLYDRMTPEEQERYQAGLLVVRHPEGEGSNLCATWHPPEWVGPNLLGGWELLEHSPHGAKCNVAQDFWLVRKPV